MGRADARSIEIVPENVHKHVEGRFSVVTIGLVVQWHAVIGAGAVTTLVVVAVLNTVTTSVEVGDRAVTVVVTISVREGGYAVTVVVA